MVPSATIPFLSSLLLLHALQVLQSPLLVVASVEDDLRASRYVNTNCSGGVDFPSFAYRQNKESLFGSLVDSVPATGFYNTSAGQNADTVYGLALCRGDVPTDICRNCSAAAIVRVRDECADNKSAMIWFDHCFVRFADVKFFGVLDPSDRIMWTDPNSSASGVDAQSLMLSLAKKAANDLKMFATTIEGHTNSTISYGLAQCTRDLVVTDCLACLQSAMAQIQKTYALSRGWRFYSRSCFMGYDTRRFFLTSPAPASALAPPRPPAVAPPAVAESPPGGKSGNQRRTVIIICSTVGTLMLATGIFVLYFHSRKKEELNEELRRYSNEMASLGNLTEDERSHRLPQFSLKSVQAATNNFSEENKLGRGGFGPVYKGELNGRLVAVKRLSERSGQGLKEFMNEVILIARLQHKNLVRLLGCCVERGEKMLIYEFMPNGSLDAFFYDPQKRKSLDWEKRFNIIMGSARGILYLHQDSRLNIIHRDLKAGNVLLDEQMTAKISDFGMARIFSGNNDPKATNIIVGTHGYMAPEYAIHGQFSVKSDVYSFGVLLLEIVSGQTYSGFHLSQMGHSLIGYAWTLWHNRRMSELIDPMLGESTPTSQILRCIHIGLLCVQEDPASRPTMSAIIDMLASDSLTLPAPKQPPLVFSRTISNSGNLPTSTNNFSVSGSSNFESLPRSNHSFR